MMRGDNVRRWRRGRQRCFSTCRALTPHPVCLSTFIVPCSNPVQFHTPVNIKNLVLHDIYSPGLTHAIPSLCRDNKWHRTTLMDRPALRWTSLAAHLNEILCGYDLLFIGVVNTLWDNLVWTCWCWLYFVRYLRLMFVSVGDLWLCLNLFDVLIFVRFMVFVRYVVCMMYVMILWYMWWFCDISFYCLDEIIKTNKKGVFWSLCRV
jgi:hypothetical protein